ncbi:hypothetical protein N7533_000236 [Penicillium manginii]|jgi:hypothetical protein|uniref:uncharacterized protein n=1 Tax=Penicillium manginii TaxID=203109 RepID=UPI002548C56A|nr:uncharacterized protein N7533_000236 [Penicillium manginii]KAJ5767653.1 hypothetical protein N7533_000236 [Penicillium manginii]
MEFENKIQSQTEHTEYTVTGGSWNAEYQVVLDSTTLYHVKNESPTPDKPQLTFFAGNGANGPIVGSAKSVRFSSDIQITLESNSLDKTSTSARLSKKGLITTRHVFETEISHQKRTFTWKSSEMIDSFGPFQSLKLVDEENNVIACFFPGGTRLKPNGALLLYVDLGESFVLMILMAALALREKQRRSANGGYGAGLPLPGSAGSAGG